MKYEESVVAFVDLLGFSEASTSLGEADRQKVLGFLMQLASLKSEFSAVCAWIFATSLIL